MRILQAGESMKCSVEPETLGVSIQPPAGFNRGISTPPDDCKLFGPERWGPVKVFAHGFLTTSRGDGKSSLVNGPLLVPHVVVVVCGLCNLSLIHI